MSGRTATASEHVDDPELFRCRRLPQELSDTILDLVPLEHLSSCSLVCKTWLWRATPRLLCDFGWPPKSRKEDEEDKEELLTRFLDVLAASPRLRGAIRTLWLGHPTPREVKPFDISSVAYTLDVSVPASKISHSHVCASLRGYAACDAFNHFVWLLQRRLVPNLEDISYGVWSTSATITPDLFDHFPSLRSLTIFTENDVCDTVDWPSTMRDLMLTPDRLEHITISIYYTGGKLPVPVREDVALDTLKAELEDKDWTLLERFLELRPSLPRFDIEQSVDLDHLEEMVRGVVDRKLSKHAAARVGIVPKGRWD
ncbi:hypothetical protein PHLGIDRAFT_117791 [Phlebiopsis gigantea 11061_1 CR5-6]|uniref:F-box domain-containing protein n=1 Tax=Phlebiopsis gigantea (strain 11061_1 CR5-6) TaxID=745531 RepID=A0A0C3RZK1_PHLG1|nr:hypothetical protein PHLGIDRAFT_117791 [Phlebiopsis gigantea 11061_1 CR5-6]